MTSCPQQSRSSDAETLPPGSVREEWPSRADDGRPQHKGADMFKVSYIHMQNYRVSRRFETREAAQEFIDVNAMVYPLPGVELTWTCEPCERRVCEDCLDGNCACAMLH